MGEVLGAYRLVEELSTGGMGTVYRAQHELLGRSAAIKLLRPELSQNDVLLQRFFNEAKAATAIRHPGIVEVYDFGTTDDGRAYIVMELLDGEPLGARIKRRGRLTEVEVATIGRGIAASLRAAHAKSIVHRDLKPDNVFLVPDAEGSGDRVKVLDFGVAKLSDPSPTSPRHTQTGVLMGTPLYMAPEQARAAGAIDHRADLYSLGCILYELLVGEPPFVAEGAGEIIALHLFGEVKRPSERVPVSPELEAVVMRLLEKEPRDRYQDAAEAQQALAEVLERHGAPSASVPDLPRSRLPPTPLPPTQGRLQVGLLDERPTLPAKKSSLPIIAGLVTVVIAAGAAFFVLSRGGDDTEKPGKKIEATATPTPAPTPTPAAAAAAAPTPAPPPAVTPAPIEPPAPAPRTVEAVKPRTVKRSGPSGKTPATAGPVVTPSEAKPRHGLQTSEGAPIEPDLGEPVTKPK